MGDLDLTTVHEALTEEMKKAGNKSDDITITMPKGVAESLADFIEWDVFDRIRNDVDIDNINWLCGICDAYRILRKAVEDDA